MEKGDFSQTRNYNILIVDDEPYIVHSLCGLLEEQKNLNLNISTAYNTIDAINALNAQRIDILMTDICLKGMSGIDLIRTVNKRWEFCKSIILTAHNNFDYIYTAGQLGVVSYILKTENDQYIVEEIHKTIQIIEAEMRQGDILQEYTKKLQEHINFTNRNLFFSILTNATDFLQSDYDQALKMLGFRSPFKGLFLVAGKLLNFTEYNRPQKSEELSKALYTIKMIMSHYVTSSLVACACEEKQNTVFWILELPETDMDTETRAESGTETETKSEIKVEAESVSWLVGMLEKVQTSCQSTAGFSVSFLVGGPIDNPSLLTTAYYKCKMMMDYSIMDQESVFTFSLNQMDSIQQNIQVGIVCKQFNFFIENRQYDKFYSLLDATCLCMEKNHPMNNYEFLQEYYPLAQFLVQSIMVLLEDNEEKNALILELYDPFRFDGIKDITNRLRQIAKYLINNTKKMSRNNENLTVNRIKEYIEAHIQEEFSLQDIAQHCSYNVSYISRLFSQKTGLKISDYIAQKKMERIKELFLNQALSISDIMNIMSFNSRSYFNRFVKHLTGQSPQKYREFLTGDGNNF